MTDGWSRERLQAVVQGELRSVARQKTPFVLRTVYAGLVAMGVMTAGSAMLSLFAARGWSGEAMAVLGARAFAAIVVIQLTLATLLGVLLGVASMHGERHNKTLGLLVLSQLRSGEIVLGKFLAILGLVVTVLLAGLPVYALLGWVGGVDYGWLRWLALYTLVLAGLGTATGLTFGLRLHSAAAAAAASLGLLACPVMLSLPYWAGGTTVLGCFGGLLWIPGSMAIGVANVALQDSSGGAMGAVVLGSGIALLFTWVLLSHCAAALAEAAAAGPGRGLRGFFEDLDEVFEKINVGGIRFDLGGRGSPRGNPVAWLTRTASGLGLPHYGFRVIAGAVLLSLVALVFATEGELWGKLIVAFWSLAAVLVPLTAGANAFGDEKHRRTLGVLLATPLRASAILRGKLYVFLRLLVLLVIPATFLIVLMLKLEAYGANDLVDLSSLLLAEAFLAYFLTLFLSLVAPTPLRAGVAGAAVLVVLHALFGLALVAPAAAGAGWGVVHAALLGWIGLAAAVGTWAVAKGRPAIGLTALLAALLPALGLVPGLPYRPETAVLGAALFIFVYTTFTFDRTVGRTP